MKVSYDRVADVLRIVFDDDCSAARELGDGIFVGCEAGGQLKCIQVSDAMKRLGDLSHLQRVVLERLGPPIAEGQPPSTIVANHVVLDENGVAWIDDTNVKVIEVVVDRVAWELGPEAIQRQHPNLSLAQIYAALAYYYDHQPEFNAEIQRQDKEVEAMRMAQGKDTPAHKKLRRAGQLP
jgi:uncharacterized protein (DUF433 family)/uncharacterized protein YuzE